MKIVSGKVVIFLVLNLASWQSYSQDLLFKKDSAPLNVIIKEFDGNTIKYTIPGDSTAKTFYITTSALDSLKYSTGKSLNFSYIQSVERSKIRHVDQNNLNIELVNCLTGNANLSYERISKSGRASFFTGIEFNLWNEISLNYQERYYSLQFYNFNPYHFFIRAGVNYFPFKYTLSRTNDSRFSSGVSLIMGSCKTVKWDYYITHEVKTVFDAALMWNAREIFYLGNHFQIFGAVEISVFPLLTFFCPEAGISVSF